MSSLPDPVTQDFNLSSATPVSAGVGAKEKEAIGGAQTGEFPYASGQEVELPKEVASVGVTAHPTTIPVPQPVAQWIKPAGQHVPVEASRGTITLPIADAEIVQGLRQDPTTSWRWLAEWCRRRIMQFHLWKK